MTSGPSPVPQGHMTVSPEQVSSSIGKIRPSFWYWLLWLYNQALETDNIAKMPVKNAYTHHRGAMIIGILLRPTAWYNDAKQQRPLFVFRWRAVLSC